jgi:hypothetical protein
MAYFAYLRRFAATTVVRIGEKKRAEVIRKDEKTVGLKGGTTRRWRDRRENA